MIKYINKCFTEQFKMLKITLTICLICRFATYSLYKKKNPPDRTAKVCVLMERTSNRVCSHDSAAADAKYL